MIPDGKLKTQILTFSHCNRKFEDRSSPVTDERALVERISTGASDIAELMEDLTPSALNATQLRDVLEQFPNLKESDVARVVGMMAQTQGALADVSSGDVWNVEQFVHTVNEMVCEFVVV